MQHIEYQWSGKDGITFYSQGWLPDGNPKAVVALVHGLGDHSGRYGHVGTALTQAGYALLGFDLRGHGKSGGARGHTPSFDVYLDDIDHFLTWVAQRVPGAPIFLYGHSLGGILVLLYTLRRKPILAGVIATSPALRNALETQTVKVVFAKIGGKLLPNMSIPSGLDVQALSHDPAVIEAYIQDPLVHDIATLSFGKHALSAIQWIFAHATEFSLPLLLVHGTADQIAFVRGSQELAALVPNKCTLKLWDGLFHETHNEPEKEQVLAYMIGWLDKIIRKDE